MKLGVIGYGYRLRHMVKEFIKADAQCVLAAVADPNPGQFTGDETIRSCGAVLYNSADEMLNTEKLDAVAIGTRCSLHSRLAISVLEAGLPLFLEKPVATTLPDLKRLYLAGQQSASQAVVSFPLRGSQMVVLAKEIIDSGKIGTVEQVQAVNNVPYGAIYYQNWYRDENETRGLFLQKATHDFDYIRYLLGTSPTEICAMKSKRIFKGSKPAGLRCADCADNAVCLESAVLRSKRGGEDWGQLCCFAEDTGNEDSGSAIIRYGSGMHVCYTQNFFARRSAEKRGARLLGYKGTLEFDFYTGELKVHMHHTARVETYNLGQGEGHHGGDAALAENFTRVARGGAASRFPLEEGVLSALTCLRAAQSAETGTFKTISLSEEGLD